jgi:predicted PurR-regulated permease PerM
VSNANSSCGSTKAELLSYSQRILIALGLSALALTLLYLLHAIADALLLVFAGVLLAIALDGSARLISRMLGLPRLWALALVLILAPAALIAFGWLVGPNIADQTSQLLESIPPAIESGKDLIKQVDWLSALVQRLPDSEQLIRSGAGVLGRIPGIFTTAVGTLFSAVLLLFMGVFLSINPGAYTGSALKLVPASKRERTNEVLTSVGSALRWWLVGRIASMLVVGVLTVIGLIIAGIPLVLTLGLLATLLAFVPLVGPIVSALPAVLIGLLDSPMRAFYAALVYIAVQALESNIITPVIQRKAVLLPPALILIAQSLMAVMFGWIGVLLSTPIMVAVIVLVQLLYVEDVLGDTVTVLGTHSSGPA